MSIQNIDKARLLAILKKKSVFHGDFVLSSGARSSYYFDCKLTTLDPEAAWLVGAVLLKMIQAEAVTRGIKLDTIGGLTMGADSIALAVGMVSFKETPDHPLKVIIVRKSPKAHGQSKLVEGNLAKGDRVVVIDDVVTRGDSTLRAIEVIEAEGGIVEFAAVLVDREEGGRQKIEARGIPVLAVFRKGDILEVDEADPSERVSATV